MAGARGRNGSTGPKTKNPDQLLIMKQRAAELYCKGLKQHVIAAELGVSQSQVSQYLKSVRDEWLATAIVDFDTRKAEELAKIDLMEKTYWEGYERSCADVTITKKESMWRWKRDEEGNITDEQELVPGKETVEVREGRGDPKWIEGVERCVTLRLRILGFLKTDTTNVALVNVDWNSLFSAASGVDAVDPIQQQILAVEATNVTDVPEAPNASTPSE